MSRALVVNCSKGYNLGALKLLDWLKSEGWQVDRVTGDPGMFATGYDLVALSVVFSWDATTARDIALRIRDYSEVWAGGPGMFALASWWRRETGLDCTRGLDRRFEHQRGDYLMTFASRGCPVNCSFCIVPRIEGVEFTLDWDFIPAPILCDNNLSALPVDFQEHIIRRYRETGVTLKDANSGFEPRTFDTETFQRWKPILKGPWRFAYDTTSESDDVRRMMDILRGEPASKKQVYCLIGNEPFEACYERFKKIIEWGGEPYCQPVMTLNALDRYQYRVLYDWTREKLRAFQRYANRHLWRYIPFEEYSRNYKKQIGNAVPGQTAEALITALLSE